VFVILTIMMSKSSVILSELGLVILLLVIEFSELGTRIFKLETYHQQDTSLRLLWYRWLYVLTFIGHRQANEMKFLIL
jgi:hypothetical protein